MNDRLAFYGQVIDAWLPVRAASILIVGAEQNDVDLFLARGFANVTLLNLQSAPVTMPAGWKFVVGNGQSLPFADESFDAVVAHATLHHGRSPHGILLEMYRTSIKTTIFIEARDSLLMKAVERCGLTQSYEVTAVHYNGGTSGGVDDTAVPNYVYRWTEREVEKTIASYAPHCNHAFDYRYGLDLPQTPAVLMHAPLRTAFIRAIRPLSWLLGVLLPRQQNLFAAQIQKKQGDMQLKPWLCREGNGQLSFDKEWGSRHFRQL